MEPILIRRARAGIFQRSFAAQAVLPDRAQFFARTGDPDRQSGSYDLPNPGLSNAFESKYEFLNAGVRWRTRWGPVTLAAGAQWQQADLEGQALSGPYDSLIERTFHNILPSFQLFYDIHRYRKLQLFYTSYTLQPDIVQLQPVSDISDPLHIRQGNPTLRQELIHALRLQFVAVNPFQQKNIFAGLQYFRMEDRIVTSDQIDAHGVRTTTPVNADGSHLLSANLQIGLPIPALSGSVRFGGRMNMERTLQWVNDAPNMIHSCFTGPFVRLDISPFAQLDLSFHSTLSYWDTRYSLQPALNTRYLSQEHRFIADWQVAWKWYFNIDFIYTTYRQRSQGFNVDVPLMNLHISRMILPYNRGEIRLAVFDLFNRNQGVSRTSHQNYVEDRWVINLRRYAQLSFTYNLNKSGLQRGSRSPAGIRVMQP